MSGGSEACTRGMDEMLRSGHSLTEWELASDSKFAHARCSRPEFLLVVPVAPTILGETETPELCPNYLSQRLP